MMHWDRIIMHHSATPDGAKADDWGAIAWYHTQVKGWEDIGYHFGIEAMTDAAGRRHAHILAGRPLWEPGAHTVGQNHRAIGVCVVGDYDASAPPDDLLDAAAKCVAQLCQLFKIPVAEIHGHREYAPKTCPGTKFDLDAFRARVQRLLDAHP